jgi:TPR repeat protein
MEKGDEDEAIAHVSGVLSRVITRLYPALREFVGGIVGKDRATAKLDFHDLLKLIVAEQALFKKQSLLRIVQRCMKTRNLVAHQKLRLEGFERALENMVQLATLIGREDLGQEFRRSEAKKEEERKVEIVQAQPVVPTLKKKKKKKKKKKANSQVSLLTVEGDSLFGQRKWLEAMNCFTRALHCLTGESEGAELFAKRASCEIQLGKFELAREDAEDALEREPKLENFQLLSEVLMRLDLVREAQFVCADGLKQAPRDPVLLQRHRDCIGLLNRAVTDANVKQVEDYSANGFLKALERSKQFTPNPEDVFVITKGKMDRFWAEKMKVMSLVLKAHTIRDKGDSKQATKFYEEAAQAGSAEGLYNLGVLHNAGRGGFLRDFGRAASLFRQACSQKAFWHIEGSDRYMINVGVAEAENSFGVMFRDGTGVDIDLKEAASWFLKSAEHGLSWGQNNIGCALIHGDGLPPNKVFAREWFLKAAEQGLPEAQKNYAFEVEQENPLLAKQWYEKAAAQGMMEAVVALQRLARSGQFGIEHVYSGSASLASAIARGDARAVFLAGRNFLVGEGGVAKDLKEAEKRFREAAKLGLVEAKVELMQLLMDPDPCEAFKFAEEAAKVGNAHAQFFMGEVLSFGHGCEQDSSEALRWFNRAKLQGVECNLERPKLGLAMWTFEKEKGLERSVSIKERIRRYRNSMLPKDNTEALEIIRLFDEIHDAAPPDLKGLARKFDVSWTPELLRRASNGSLTAQWFLTSMGLRAHAVALMMQNRLAEGFARLREALQSWDIYLDHPLFHVCVAQVLELDSKQADAQFAFLYIFRGSTEERVDLAEKFVVDHPLESDFHHLLACAYGFAGNWEASLRAIDRALYLKPDKFDWLYHRATALRLLLEENCTMSDTDRVVNAYEMFLSKNPPDHRKVPEALYCVAMLKISSQQEEFAISFYARGQAAEDSSIRLPNLAPIEDTWGPKRLAKACMLALKAKWCAACKKIGPNSRCACEQVWYCDKSCQKAHWNQHRSNCTFKK